MFNNKKYQHKLETMTLRNRIRELEEIICPCGEHEFVQINYDTVTDCYGGVIDAYTVRKLQCRKCKKIVSDDDRIGFKYKAVD